MGATIKISPTNQLAGSIRPPGSKSITNRALVCAALAEGRSTLRGVLDSEDTAVMMAALRHLGVGVVHEAATGIARVEGCGGRIPNRNAELYVANSGTTVRFLAAVVTLGQGHFRLDGSARMRQRPIEDLLKALRQLGVNARSETQTGCPPVVIEAAGLGGGRAEIAADISSQFLSGLMMAAPYARQPVELLVQGELVSEPYILMTRSVMAAFGVDVQAAGQRRYLIPKGVYQSRTYAIEPDASAASYFFAAAAITGGQVTVEGLSRESVQGDVGFCQCLQEMGCRVEYGADRITVCGGPLRGIELDMNAISDTVQTLGAVALFAEGPTTVRGVAHIRHKETDRLHALAQELRKFGAAVDEYPDGLRIAPRPLHGAEIDTYDDHRMAMSMALVGLRVPGVVIRDPGCTRKTYPRFFDDLAAVTGQPAKSRE